MVLHDAPVELSSGEGKHLIAGSEKVLLSCNFNSRDHQDLFEAGPSPDRVQIGQITITFPTPQSFETVGGAFSVDAIELDLLAAFPGQPSVRSGEESFRFVKCAGHELVGVACSEAGPEVLRENYGAICARFRTWGADFSDSSQEVPDD